MKGTKAYDSIDEALDHIPDLTSVESLVDLLTLCNLGILHNVIDSESYTHSSCIDTAKISDAEKDQLWNYDFNASIYHHRRAAIHTRALALELIEWVDKNYYIKPLHADGATVDQRGPKLKCGEIARLYLAQQCAALLRYKELAVQKKESGVDNCSTNMLRR